MSSAHLPDFIDNAEFGLEILIPDGVAGSLDFDGIHKLCDRFRQRGVCGFLLIGDPQIFFTNAMQSAGAYARCITGVDDTQKVTSRARPLYDAVACGFWDCARDISGRSRTTWNPSKEYEDDFLFVLFLMKHFFLNGTEAECRAIIAEHERAAEGADQEHRDVCTAFLDKDGGLFDAALRELLRLRAKKVEAMVVREAIPEEDWSWLRYFSSEGLALLKLAELSGLSVGKDYLHVSERLRVEPAFGFDPNAWQTLRYGRQP